MEKNVIDSDWRRRKLNEVAGDYQDYRALQSHSQALESL